MVTKLNEMKILIVDDDPISLKLLGGILKKNGYHNINFSKNGEDALEIIEKDPHDLVLLDIFLPGIEGYEVCRRLKKDENTAHIPILMITGGAVEADEAIEKSSSVGAMDFISKPIRSIDLLSRVKSALTIKQKHEMLLEELERRIQAENSMELLIHELQKALAEVKQLSGMLPICCHCKKIRDDKGYWSQIEEYIKNHSEASFSHGICPDCIKKYYPEFNKSNKKPSMK